MKTNIEKLNKVPKNTPEVSPKALIDEVSKKTPRKNTNRVQAYGYQRPMGKLVSEKGPSEAKPRRSRKKAEEEPIPELPQLDMRPLDEQEDFDHTKKGMMSRKQWKTPENIPVEDFTEAFDTMTLENIMESSDDEGEFLEREFGTKNPKEIDKITAERLKSGDYEQVVIRGTKGINGKEFKSAPKIKPEYGTYIPPSTYQNVTENAVDTEHYKLESRFAQSNTSPLEDFQDKQVSQFLKQKTIHGNPNSYEYRGNKKTSAEIGKSINAKDETIRNINRGFLGKLKNFWLELKNDTKNIAEELGWDEEAELEKNALQYQENLKNEELHAQEIGKTLPPKGSEFVGKDWTGDSKRPYSKDSQREAA